MENSMEFDSYDFDLTRISRFIGVEKCFMREKWTKSRSKYYLPIPISLVITLFFLSLLVTFCHAIKSAKSSESLFARKELKE